MKLTQEEKLKLIIFLKRALKVLVFIIFIRLIRIYIRSHSDELVFIRDLYRNGNERDFVAVLLQVVIIGCFIGIAVLFTVKGRKALIHPLFMSLIIFMTIDIIFLLVYPELFIAILDTSLFYGMD